MILWRKNNSLEFTVLRHKITVLAPFCSYPVTDFLIPSHVHVILDVRTYSCCRTSHMFAIHCEHDRFCSQVQVAVYRMQMLLYMWHIWQRCKYLYSAISHIKNKTKLLFSNSPTRSSQKKKFIYFVLFFIFRRKDCNIL